MRNITFDIIGDIAIVKFGDGVDEAGKKKLAEQVLREMGRVKTVLEKAEKIKGRLRILKTRFIAGEDKKETIHVENGCRFKLNIEETYFSPRLCTQRLNVAEDILKYAKRDAKILVLFAGVAPFSIVIAKKLKEKGKKFLVVSNELNRKASKYAEENVKLNKLNGLVEVVQGDAKKIYEKLKERKLPTKYDFIVMARPNLKDTFLPSTLKLAKKGTKIYYHGFGTYENVLEEIEKDAGKKIGKIKIEKAGEIAPFKFRWLATFKVN